MNGCCVCKHTLNFVVFHLKSSSWVFILSFCIWFLQWYVFFYIFLLPYFLPSLIYCVHFLIKKNKDYKNFNDMGIINNGRV